MTIYNVIIISHGEVPLSLDGVYTFTSEKDARKKLRERYNNVISDVEGYEITDEEFGDKYYRVEIDDDEGSIYEGYIRKTELEEKDEEYENQKHSLSELSNTELVKLYDLNPSGMILDELTSRNLHTVCDLCRKGKIAEALDWLKIRQPKDSKHMTKTDFYAQVFGAAQRRIEGGLTEKECDFITEALYDPKNPNDWSWSDFYDLMDCINDEDGNVIYALQANYDNIPDIEDDDNFLLVAAWMEQHPEIKNPIVEEYCAPLAPDQVKMSDLDPEIVLDEASMMKYNDRLDCLLYVVMNRKES